ncbi:MAG: hypothetical protein GY842_10150, partial [bacterium]|nr:hypothetical protein [bacterium]
GDLLAIGAESREWPDAGKGRRIADDARYALRLDWSGRLLWKRHLPAHDALEGTPDGQLLMLTLARKRVAEIHPDTDVRDDQLTLIAPDGSGMESHSILEALQRYPGGFPLRQRKPDGRGGPPWVDLFHANSVQWMRYDHLVDRHPLYARDNILVCFRHQDMIAVFNWPRNELVWHWGRGRISGPHDAQVLPSGHILLFDNGLGRGHSRAVELDPLSERIVWQYQADPPTDFYTAAQGSAQRLPNGNTLMAESDKGRAIEVTPSGEIVWEFVCPHKVTVGRRASILRMLYYAPKTVEAILERHGPREGMAQDPL